MLTCDEVKILGEIFERRYNPFNFKLPSRSKHRTGITRSKTCQFSHGIHYADFYSFI